MKGFARRPAGVARLIAGLLTFASGCAAHHENHLEFEGFAAGGQKFRIWRDLSWWEGWRERPRYDRLVVAWPRVELKQFASEVLVDDDAGRHTGFLVRSAGNRIWLIPCEGGAPFAAMDFEAARAHPVGDPLPEWAQLKGGMLVGNLAPEALAHGGIPAIRIPALTLKNINGGPVALPTGGVTLLNFFGVNCAPCRMEAPHLAELHRTFGKDGLQVVCVNAWNDAPAAVREYARAHGLPQAQVLLNGRELADRLQVDGVPKNFWINAEGWVLDIHSGFGPGGAAELLERTRKALAASGQVTARQP